MNSLATISRPGAMALGLEVHRLPNPPPVLVPGRDIVAKLFILAN